MDKTKLILAIPAAVVFVLIVVHSLRVHGFRTTRNFFLWCLLFCYGKEFINSHAHSPEYMASGLEIIGVPMMVPIGWVISIYLSWFLAEALLRRTRYDGTVLPTVAVSCVCIAAVSLCVECSGGNMGWWRWNYAVPGLWVEDPILKMPVKIIGGWATTNLIFMTLFMLFEFSRFKKTKRKALKIFLIFVVLGATVGVMATNLVLRHYVVAPLVVVTILIYLFSPRIRSKLAEKAADSKIVERFTSLRGKAGEIYFAKSRDKGK